jgi:hypothetical protein
MIEEGFTRLNARRLDLATKKLRRTDVKAGGLNAPTGHRREAQGCEERATLGQHAKIYQPQMGLCQTS